MKSFILLTTILGGCFQESSSSLHKGYDIQGNWTNCLIQKKTPLCSQIFGEAEIFANKCKEQGYKSLFCGCHNFLCTGHIKTNSPLATKQDIEAPKEER